MSGSISSVVFRNGHCPADQQEVYNVCCHLERERERERERELVVLL